MYYIYITKNNVMKKSELRQLIREEILDLKLNEKLISNQKNVEIYMNPKTIKRMEDYSRAVTDDRGNLYIVNSTEWIHKNLITWLNNVMKTNLDKNPYENVDKTIAWQKEKGNSLYLSPAYHSLEGKIDKIEEMIEKARKKNPNIEFNLGISSEHMHK